MLLPTASWPVSLTTRFLLLSRQLRVCWCGALSLTRGRVCRLQFLPVLASAVILGSECFATREHILVSQIRDFPFHRLLRLAGLRWRYSTPPPHVFPFYTRGKPNRNHPPRTVHPVPRAYSSQIRVLAIRCLIMDYSASTRYRGNMC
jgi:hypothetical protein